ncbi:MAG: hypothetical protein ABI441_03705 [Flavobacterium sp.]
MTNKDNIIIQEKNKVITPKKVKEALENLPFDYVKQTLLVMSQWQADGKISKTYTDRYIQKVRKSQAYNKEILEVLVEVGLTNKKTKDSFGFEQKKTSQTN